jgi:hypothetical protein
VKGNTRLPEGLDPHVLVDQPLERALGHERITAARKSHQAGEGAEREHVPSLEPSPHVSEGLSGRHCLLAGGDERAVQSPHGGPADQVRDDAPLVESAQHAGLHSAQARAAGEHERRFPGGRLSMVLLRPLHRIRGRS